MRHPVVFFTLSVALASCGSASATSGNEPLPPPRFVEGTHVTGSGSEAVGATPIACGATPGATDGRPCVLNSACHVAAWTCQCEQRMAPQCGGAQRPPQLLPPTWSCAPDDPTTASRDDGCPFTPPDQGAPCTRGANSCHYRLDACGRHTRDARCTNGTWAVEDRMTPPPP